MNNEFQKIPEEGTPEYDQMMKQYYGEDYELGYRVGFGKRFGAYIIDLILYFFLSAIYLFSNDEFLRLINKHAGETNMFDEAIMQEFAGTMAGITPVIAFISFAYFSLEIFFAQTVGKMILGIKIGNENRNNADLTQLLIRFFGKNLNTVLSLIFVITSVGLFDTLSSVVGFVIFFGCFMVFGRTRQALHDLPAKTAVFSKHAIKEN